jgi:hypothetical protein
MPRGSTSGHDGAGDHNEVSPGYRENVLASDSTTGRRARKASKFITNRQASNLMEAFEFAERIGRPLNVSVDIYWLMFSGNVDDRTRFSRAQERWSKWTARHNFPLTMIWTREIGKHGSLHTHVLLHVPPWLMEDRKFYHKFHCELERSFEREGGPNHEQAIKVQPAPTARAKLLYILKGLDPQAAELPLPRPRPAELKPETIESSKAPAELSPETIEQSEAPAQPAPASDESEKETTSAPLND